MDNTKNFERLVSKVDDVAQAILGTNKGNVLLSDNSYEASTLGVLSKLENRLADITEAIHSHNDTMGLLVEELYKLRHSTQQD